MNTKYIFAFTLVSCFCSAQISQIYQYPDVTYRKATSLYQEELYRPAQFWFERVIDENRTSSPQKKNLYYLISSGVRSGERNSDAAMIRFINENPAAPLVGNAALEMADFYFQRGDYAKALQWYNRVQDYEIDWKSQEKYNFQKGYALFAGKNKEAAQKYLSQVKHSEKYGSQAQYYLGYMAYDNNDFDLAKDYFHKVQNNNDLNQKLSYYQADMNFKQGHFSEAIEESVDQLKRNPSAAERSELNKIIGESYFNLKEYDKALPYLLRYKGKHGKFSNTDYYYLGYALYSKGDFAQAINYFNKIIGASDSVAQNAYYHLGECYLKMQQKQEALNAFRNASQMNFDTRIQQNAFLNYARLSYEIGNPFESVPLVLKSYIDRYEPYREEIQELLLSSYLTSKDYDAALQVLEESSDVKSQKTYQQVAFLSALDQYNEKQYSKAIALFQKARKLLHTETATRSLFWIGESLYQQRKYQESTKALLSFIQTPNARKTPEYEKGLYALGYLFLQQKNFSQALSYFDQFISVSQNENRKADAFLRMGDAYFAEGKYHAAVQSYEQAVALQSPKSDYARFQQAIAYGLQNQNSQKIETLDQFIKTYKTSSFHPDALYELANTWSSQGNEDKAVAFYQQLQQQYPNLPLTSRAILREGLIYYNQEKLQPALSCLKRVAEHYPNTTEASQAVATAKLIYIDLGQVDAYAQWVKQLSFVHLTENELENANFEAAEKQYTLQNQDNAIKGFEQYLNRYPDGAHALSSQFYLAQLYNEKGKYQEALSLFEKVEQQSPNDFSEVALVRICEILIRQKQFSRAMASLKKLEQQAQHSQNTEYAQSNLMRLSFENKDWDTAISYAKKIAEQNTASNEIKADAHYILAHSYFALQRYQQAQSAYEIVLKEASGSRAAEALYFKAYFEHQKKQYKTSNQTIQKLAKEYATYKEFSAKGLILMAKNFDALGDAYQAHFILENVISNFSDDTQVVEEATLLLNKVKEKAAKNNSSVEL